MALDSPTDHALTLRGVDEVHVLVGVGAEVEYGKPVIIGRFPLGAIVGDAGGDQFPPVRANHTHTAAFVLGVPVAVRKAPRAEVTKHALPLPPGPRHARQLEDRRRDVDRAADSMYHPLWAPGDDPHLHVRVEHLVRKGAM